VPTAGTPEKESTTLPLSGKTFVITGTLAGYSRQEAQELLENKGGKVTNSISRKTDYLVMGEKPGSKQDKAISLGVKILDEAAFEELLNQ
jgi:DNA ligase (NAD+)